MNKTLVIFLFFFFLIVSGQSFAQKKEWAVGIRGGEPTGLNVRKYFGSDNALDITLGAEGYAYGYDRRYWRDYYRYRRSVVLMINYIWQKPIKGTNGVADIYYGFGGKLGSRRYYDNRDNIERGTLSLGLTGVVGVEFFIPETPISFFLDLGPYLEFAPAPFALWFDAGLGVRFNF